MSEPAAELRAIPIKDPTSESAAEPEAKGAAECDTEPTTLNPVDEICSQIEELDIKARKKAKEVEMTRLTKLSFQRVLDEIKPLESVEFEPFLPGDHREPKANIPPTTGLTDPLALLDLFISPQMYITIAENTNLYATAQNATTIQSSTNF